MHSHSILGLGAAALVARAVQAAESGTGHTTRYWDCCKPSCAWNDKAAVSSPVLTCDANFNPLSDPNTKSGCDGGSAYACGSQSPWAVNDNLAYGFAATAITGGSESSWCCACYALTFTSGPASGKTMVVQSTNTGGDLSDNHFDIQMPGGGLGIFDGCTPQFGGLPGERYGGVSSVDQCAQMPSQLQEGCEWRFGWFANSDNPDVSFERVQCPAEIVDKSKCKRDDDGSYPAFGGAASSGSEKVASGSSSSSKTAVVKVPAESGAASLSSTATTSTTTSQAASEKAAEPSVKAPGKCKRGAAALALTTSKGVPGNSIPTTRAGA